ncbi:AraC family transcriptional regulator [Paenibacillus oryzisoli]|uniref:HTH araC/xylS-type domain-containing protein n=1 Tax=Paenibacillus oryzisoli TaxID=1850517 RepID=A0A198AN22_9BACL|nr:AraC family transcriptional regulator [Paenibacillus oryzisoli]OAS22391.1 hypothetical protein A8708_12545 [Paenibacillus oryzisoli]
MIRPFYFSEFSENLVNLPLYLYSVGNHYEKYLSRSEGYRATQIFMTYEGSGTFDLFEQGKFTLGEQQVCIIRRGVPHEYYPAKEEDWNLGFIGFNGHAADAILSGMPEGEPLTLSPELFQRLWNDMAHLWQMTTSQVEDAPWKGSVILYSLILSMYQELRLPAPSAVSSTAEHSNPLNRAIQLMNAHYAEPLLITNLAHAVGYSVQHFNRIFRKHYDISPHEYLQRIRLQRAIQFMEEHPDISVNDTANSVGWDANYFIRVFKQEYGVTPKVHHRNWHMNEDNKGKVALPSRK